MKKKNSEGELEFGVYEVYYDEKREVVVYTQNSLIPMCSSEDDIKYELNHS